MVFCLIALVVFGVLGIFSAKYRQYAKEALRCVVTMAQFRPCDSQFDRQMKGKIVLKLSRVSPPPARGVGQYFELISWLLVLSMFASFIGIIIGVYNWYLFGNCNGPGSASFCVLNSVLGDRTVVGVSNNVTENLRLLNGG